MKITEIMRNTKGGATVKRENGISGYEATIGEYEDLEDYEDYGDYEEY